MNRTETHIETPSLAAQWLAAMREALRLIDSSREAHGKRVKTTRCVPIGAYLSTVAESHSGNMESTIYEGHDIRGNAWCVELIKEANQ